MEKATFAAGCFWGIEEAFRNTKGVNSTAVGYIGGNLDDPTYKDVCSGATGHAEAVQIEYDPSTVSYNELLNLFWKIHNPTTLNRQGPDIGTQYRSAIFCHGEEQETAAKAMKKKFTHSGQYTAEVVTEIVPATKFYRAEEYHQCYLHKRKMSSCYL